ncbi:MAG: ligand-binding protein SH3, partial [Candidatus Omnitrophota bacterium]
MILGWLEGIPKEIAVMIIGALPVFELRGALPLALYWEIPMCKAFWLAVLGNLIPVAPLLLLLEPVSRRLRKFKLWSRFFDWLFERTRKKADVVQKYEALGLAM